MGGGKSNKINKCPECSKSFPYESQLKIHYRVHSGEKKYRCGTCKESFASKSYYFKHRATHDANRSRLTCPHCPETFQSHSGLGSHIARKHVISNNIRHKCIFCSRHFLTNSILESHIRKHINELPYFCRSCGKEFSTLGDCSRHQRTHQADRQRQFPCTICSKSFYENDKLLRHLTSHLCEKPHKCEICGMRFKDRTVLKNHLATHSGKKTVPCDKCPKMFSIKQGMKNHRRRVHENEQKYKCEYCSKKFNVGEDLKRHARIHNGDRTFWCATCEKSFTTKLSMQKHAKLHLQRSVVNANIAFPI